MSKSKREKGVEMIKEVYCGDVPVAEEGQDAFMDFMLGSLFGELWANDVLTIEQRRLLLLGAIAAQGEEMTFTIQSRSAMKRGELDFQQMEEVVRFITQYVGYPRGSKMKMALGGLKKEFDKQ